MEATSWESQVLSLSRIESFLYPLTLIPSSFQAWVQGPGTPLLLTPFFFFSHLVLVGVMIIGFSLVPFEVPSPVRPRFYLIAEKLPGPDLGITTCALSLFTFPSNLSFILLSTAHPPLLG